ncbi:MAG TPA: flagellar hook-length control protein FliK [Ruminiclostridium sp.]
MRIDGFVPGTGITSNNSTDVLSKLNPGDTIRAQVLENSGSELTLKLSDGSKVSAHAMSPVAAAEGEFVNFVFKGNVDGKPVLEVASRNVQPQVDETLENIKSTLTTLKLPITDQNIELAQALKDQNVPITADSMRKIIDLVSKNTDLKPDSAAFLTAANMSNDINNIEKLQSLLAGRLKISNDIGELMKLIDGDSNISADVKSAVVSSILEKQAAQMSSKGVNQTNNTVVLNKEGAVPSANTANPNTTTSPNTNSTANPNTATTPNTNSTTNPNTATISNVNGATTSNPSNVAGSTSNVNANLTNGNITNINVNTVTAGAANGSSINNNAAYETASNNVINLAKSLIESAENNAATVNSVPNDSKASDIDANTNSNVNSAANGRSNNNTSNVEQQISNLLKDGAPLDKADLPLLNSLNSQLESMISKGNLSTEQQLAAKFITEEINDVIFKTQGNQAVSEQVSPNTKNMKGFEDAVNNLKNLFIKIDQNSDEINPVKLYKDMDNALQTLKSSIQQLPQGIREAAMNIANNLESNMNFINKLNSYSSYVQIPLSIFNKETTGELYMLKKGSKSRKLDPSNITVLISLDSNNIGRIDTLLSIDKKNISTNFRLENSEVFKVLKENHKMLYTSLLEKGFRLVDFTYRLMNEPISIVNFEAEAKKEFIKSPNNIDITI